MISLNGEKIEAVHFPDRTSQVWKLPPPLLGSTSFRVLWKFDSEAEFLHLAQLKMLLDTYGRKTALEIRYLPYARQDKAVANETTFALRPFAHLLNALKFDEIVLLDPHSAVALELIRGATAVYPRTAVDQVISLLAAELVCYPDKGARARYGSIYPFASIYGEKVRDQSTGQIMSYEVVGEAHGKRVLIIDDICDGGATFTLLARGLLAKGAAEVNLFVTHGLFSKGLAPLRDAGIRHVFTNDGQASEYQNQIVYKEINP